MLKLNKQLTAIALFTVTTLAGTTLTANQVSAASNGCNNVVKNIELTDAQNRQVFCSNDTSVANLSQFGGKATNVSIQNPSTYKFYTGPNFTGQSVTIQGAVFQRLGLTGVSSFKKIK